jgi:hypothetical protein
MVTTPIVFIKPEVIPEVWPNLSPSLNDVQNMINSALERQVKSIDELLCRLIEEWDGKKPDATTTNPSSSTCAVGFTQTNPHTSMGGWHINAKPLCPADESLPQPNHRQGFGS